nr:MFS transporter [Gordonia sp. NB41Y]
MTAGTGPGGRSSLFTVFTAVAIMLVAANLRPAVVAVSPLLDEITRDEGYSSAMAGMLTTLPVLFFGLVSPLAPPLAARFGIERTVFGSLLLLIVGSLLRLIPDTACLFLGSAVVGIAIGICNVVLPALIKRDFAHRSGLMTGLYSMTLSGGAAVAVGVIVPINHAFDGNWRMSLASWAILAVITACCWLPQLTRHRPETVARRGSLYRNPIAWAITIFMAAQSLIFYTFSAWLPTYLISEGHTAAAAGTVLAIGQTVALFASLIAPIIAGRFADQRVITLVAVAFTAVGLTGLLTIGHVPVLWTILTLVGPGSSISLVLLFMVLRSSSPQQTGQVSGMSQSIGYVLAALGPFVTGALHDLTGSWTIALGMLGIPVVVQALSAWWAARDVKMDEYSH